MSKFCCDGECNQGRDCPNRKPQEIKWLIYNNIGYISTFISFLIFGFILFEL
jgi:hypothetical protein